MMSANNIGVTKVKARCSITGGLGTRPVANDCPASGLLAESPTNIAR